MSIIYYLIASAFGMATYFLIYFCVYRNTLVCKLQLRVNNACYNYKKTFLDSLKNDGELESRRDEWETRKRIADDMNDRYGYDKMVFSFRPLKIEEWYTEKECEIIKNYGYED